MFGLSSITYAYPEGKHTLHSAIDRIRGMVYDGCMNPGGIPMTPMRKKMRNDHMENYFDEEQALEELEAGYGKAEEILEDEDKLERFLQRLEKKLKKIPFAGEKLASVPVLAALVKNYVQKEYTDIPIGTIIAIVSALIYFVSPIDILPDSIPFLGYFDDAAVVSVCWKLVETDVDEFIRWRIKNNKALDI